MTGSTPESDADHLDNDALAELQDVMEDEFELLIRTFVTDSRERIHTLRQALADADADALAKAAHSFKGSSINIGAPKLGALCLALERAGKAGELSGAADRIDGIDAEFAIVVAELETLMAR
ncbi:Hpt domain-containing protein [Marinobacter sp. C2H3]|uniref:Hpt domain-containing protein n=1 Tax=Marinobacter sp. C2H3 TaxID=3119003 RepID=UPI00300E7D1E